MSGANPRRPNSAAAMLIAAALPIAAALLGTGAAIAPATAHDGDPRLARLGKVEFANSCKAEVQADFTRAMALTHSFAWKDAGEAFAKVAKDDPTCGIAHWGRAVVLLDNPFIWPANLPPARMNEIAGALDAARAAGLKTPREAGYVEAVTTFVRDHEKLNHRTRLQSFDDAMQKLAAANPADKEAAVFSALITSANFDPTDKTYGNQLKAAKRLEPLFVAQSDHPGVAHYLIHSYDYPPLAKQGLEAARRYAKIAPDAPHALHMPSHIFTRVGAWKDSIEANSASAKSAGEASFDGHHATDYMVYAHLQLGQDKAAREVMAKSLGAKPVDHFAAAFAYAAMPARMTLELGDWKAAAKLPLLPADGYPWKKYPQAEAINAFARGVGAARSGDAAGAKAEHTRLIALREAAREAKLGYWVGQIDIQAEVVNGLASLADGMRANGIEVLRAAAAREDATEKHAVVPGPLLPAREILADVLAGLKAQNGQIASFFAGVSRSALAEYEAVLTKEPNRYRALLGAARAAQKAGDTRKARDYFARISAQGRQADAGRAGVQQAKTYLAQR